MARDFDNGSSEYLEIDSAPVTAAPLTIAAWGNVDETWQSGVIASLVDASSGNDWFLVRTKYQSGPGEYTCNVYARSSDGLPEVDSTTTFAIGGWHHLCGVFASASSRSAYLDGGAKATITDTITPSGIDKTSIGRIGDSTPAGYFEGKIAEVGIWNAALTDAEVAILAKGYSPLLVRPQSLVFYAPLIRDEDRDIVGGLALTPVNTPSIAAHPRVIYPAPRYTFIQAAAGGGTVYYSTPAGVLTFAGTVARLTATSKAGIIVPAGTVLKLTSTPRAGAITPAGAVLKQTATPRAGAITPAGATVKQTQTTKAGAITWAGAVVAQAQKVLAGALTPAGAIVKRTARTLAGAFTGAGAVAKATARTLAGAFTSSGTVVKATARVLAGALTPAGAVIKATAKTFAGAITPSGVASGIRTVFQALAGAITFTGAVTRRTSKTLAGALTPVGTLAKRTARTLAGALTFAGAAAGAVIGTAVVTLTLAARSLALTLKTRSLALALRARSAALTLLER